MAAFSKTASFAPALNMHVATGGVSLVNGGAKDAVFEKAAIGNSAIDASAVLDDDAPGPHDHMTDFGVAHLAARQAGVFFGSAKQGARAVFPERIPHRCLRRFDGVRCGGFTVAPAIKDNKNNGFWY